jgi:iron complex transport system permease protein
MKNEKEDNYNLNISGKSYNALVKRRLYVILAAAILLLALLTLDLLAGPAGLSIKDVFSAILFPSTSDKQVYIIVWLMRLPIAVMAIMVGASMGVAGAEMQTILDNPLASPYTLGISSAAAFGAAMAILGKGIFPINQIFMVPVNAFLFAMLSSLLIYSIAKTKQGASHTLVLTGVAFSFLFTSMLSFLQYIAKEDQFQAIVFWMFGSLEGATWTKAAVVGGILLISLPLLLKDSWMLTALKMGDSKAKSMGVNVARLRLKVLIIISVITAVSVCFTGTIGFVGLVAPHIARSFVGEDQRFFLPCSALFGAVMLSFASIVSKTIIPGAVFPVGITTSFIGIPFLLTIILRKRRLYA